MWGQVASRKHFCHLVPEPLLRPRVHRKPSGIADHPELPSLERVDGYWISGPETQPLNPSIHMTLPPGVQKELYMHRLAAHSLVEGLASRDGSCSSRCKNEIDRAQDQPLPP